MSAFERWAEKHHGNTPNVKDPGSERCESSIDSETQIWWFLSSRMTKWIAVCMLKSERQLITKKYTEAARSFVVIRTMTVG